MPFATATLAASNVATDKAYTSGVTVPNLTPNQGFEKFFGINPNGNWTLTVTDGAAGDVGILANWSITVRAIPNVVCELAAAPDVTVGTDPGLATGTYTTTPPATVEPVAGVCTGAVVTVTVDGISRPINSPVSLPIGTHNVVYTVTSACGTDTELVVVTVEDQEDPAFTNCPAGTLIYTLAPGACDYQFDLALVATDNVGFPGGATTASFEIHELLAPGNYSFPISITDAAGNGPVTCTVNVTVNPYPTPITSLICNDLVTVSLDESCTLEVNADQVLEGGPYHCYDDYIVEIDRTLPLGNGPWVPAVLGPGDVHKTYAVRVTDDTNGNDVADANEVKCWGNIAVEDKLPPVFETCGCTEGAVAVSSFTGSLDASDPTFNRPLSGAPCGLSGVGTNVFYETFTFTVETAGSYSFAESTPTDGFGALYAGSFDPSNPCANFVNSNDDGNGNLDFLITSTLAPGTYVLVVTTFSNAATGAYTVTVSPSVLSGPPSNCEFYCADKDGLLNGSIAAPLPVVTDNCSTPTVTKKDVFVEGGACEDDYIIRTWTATDAWGNSSQCTQELNLIPYTLDDVEFPEDITIDCAGCGVTAGTEPCITGVPTVPGNNAAGEYGLITYNGQCQVQSEGLCNLGAQKHDTKIVVCPGTFKILRHWTVLDWCTNTVLEHDQLIKVVDNEGPAIATPGDMTVSTNPSQCCATVNLPDVIVEDACSATASISAMVVVYDQYLPDQIIGTYNINGNTLSTFPGNNFWDCDTLGRYGITPCLPIGHHQVMYMAEDVCGNTNQISFWLTVVDDVAPVATCTQFTTVAIGVDDPTDCYEPTEDCQFGGVTWVPASAFDQGSHDNCSPIEFTIRRMPEADGTYSDCIDGLAPLCDGYEYNVATTENDSIKFYCCEVGTTQTVILRVYQLDINGNRDYYRNPDGSPLTDPDGAIQYIYNECMINVEVQDKIKPTCQAPAPVTINCENFEPSLWAYGYPSSVDNCCLDQTPPTSADPQGQVGIPSGTTAIPGVCGMTQKTYYSGFLGANFDTTCNRGTIVRRFTAWDCQGFSSSCTQRIVVTNQQAYDIKFPADKLVNCVTAPDFGKPIITNDEGCELIGVSYNDVVFTIVPDACYKIERTWTVINWCTYIPDNPCVVATRNPVNQTTGLAPAKDFPVNSEVNCVTYKQIIKVIDQTPPTVTCQDIDTCDYSTNNPRYWNYGDNWWDNGTMQHDLCEKSTNISVTAEDFCDTLSPTGGLRFRYLLFLDLDGDQIMETVVSSADAVTRPLAAVLYGNYNTALYHGGVQWLFDNTSTANQKYRFDIEQTANGARVIWRNAAGSVIDPELAHGRHKIKWIAEDGCGNEAVCEKTFEIRDCKPPVVACANVNINLMVGGMATLWASDFFLYGDDNCTPDPILEQKLAVIRADENPGNQFPTDLPQSIVVTCADQGTLVPVQVWLQDAAGNADFCIAYVDVQANIVGCPNGTSATVAGALATGTQGVEQATVEVTGTPNVNLTQTTGDNGAFSFNNVPLGASVVVTPTKDDNPLNGVTTYDLVLVSKHILGLEPLNTPYKMIAADANRSGSITTFDIVEFRKLILGIYNELPNNTSWRFVDKSHVFPNPSNPFQGSIPENISIASLSADMMANNFEAVKIGDVNGSAIANSLQSAEERTASTMLFDVEDRAVKAGETFTVNFKGAEKVQGYQFTMNFNGLEVMDIAGNGDIKAENFGVFQDALTTSVDGSDNEFAVTFRASKAGQLSSMLGVSSRITKAEAYSLANNRMDVAFRFNGQNGATISGVGFELYQNQPNPFVNKTFIGFHLPEAADATLRIFDETGRMVFTQSGSFAKGYNTISVDRQLLNTTGVLYYTLETATDSATKKMIQSK